MEKSIKGHLVQTRWPKGHPNGIGAGQPAWPDTCLHLRILPGSQNPPALTSLGFMTHPDGEKNLHPENLVGEN